MPAILLLNGPNLNLLGTREPDTYGSTTLADVEANCRAAAARHGHTLEALQSNHEGALIDALHAAGRRFQAGELLGVVINPGAYTHSSIALRDAIAGVAPLPVVEVHISNVHAREPFRHHSHVSPVAAGVVVGFGVAGYVLAIEGLVRKAAGG